MALFCAKRALSCFPQAYPPKPFPKLPTKLLRDFSPKGPLYTVAATVHDVRRSRDLKKFDLLAAGFRKQARHLNPPASPCLMGVLNLELFSPGPHRN